MPTNRDSLRSDATATRTRSGRSKPKESTSSRTPYQTVVEAIQAAIYHLSTIAPHTLDGAKYSRADWRPYTEGYYCALVYTLRAIEHTLARRAHAEQRQTAGDLRRGGLR